LLQPYPVDSMEALRASAVVNSVRDDDPGLLVSDAVAG
jgi:hypothetical protein